MLIDFILQFLE